MKRITVCIYTFIICSTLLWSGEVSRHRQAENLNAFIRLYGYVRHFHPSNEAQEIDWDKMAVYGASQVRKATNNTELQNILEALFLPVAPTLQFSSNAKFPAYSLPPTPMLTERTFWQYAGYANPGLASVYSSFRANRSFRIPKVEKTNMAGSLLCFYPPGEMSARDSLKVSFLITKAKPDTSTVFMGVGWGEQIVYDSLNTNGWQQKEFVLAKELDPTGQIVIYLFDSAQLLLDSLSVEILQKGQWNRISLNDFQQDTIGEMPKGFTINLNISYPAMRLPNSDVYIMELDGNKVLSCNSSKTELPYTLGFNQKLYSDEPSPDAFAEGVLSKNLYFRLPLTVPCDKANTYPLVQDEVLRALQDSLAGVDINNRLEINTWFGAMCIYWNQLQHFYPYWQYTNTNWKNDLQMAIKQTFKCRNITQFVLAMSQLASKTKDSHAQVYDNSITRRTPGFYAERMAGKWIVTRVTSDSLGIAPGSELLKLNGKSIAKYIKKHRKYFCYSSTHHSDKMLFVNAMKSYPDTTAVFTYRNPLGKIETAKVSFKGYINQYWFSPTGTYTVYPDSVFYVNLGQKGLGDNEVDALLPRLVKAKGVIFDLRDYPKRNNGLISHLLSASDTLRSHLIRRSIYPDANFVEVKDSDYSGWNLPVLEPQIAAKTVFLCGSYSVSYCESMLMQVKYNKLGTIIGQPTAGSTGNIVLTNLPAGLVSRWTGMFVCNPDRTRFHGVGIIPDIIVTPNQQDITNGIDTELEAALRFIRED